MLSRLIVALSVAVGLASGATATAVAAPVWVTISSSPPGAAVYVDGKEQGARGITAESFRVRLSPGLHRVLLELPGFLGLPAIVSTTDLLATLPRQIGETLAQVGGLAVFACPVPIPTFVVKKHWHARYHHDAGNRWLRGLCAQLFMRQTPRPRAPRL